MTSSFSDALMTMAEDMREADRIGINQTFGETLSWQVIDNGHYAQPLVPEGGCALGAARLVRAGRALIGSFYQDNVHGPYANLPMYRALANDTPKVECPMCPQRWHPIDMVMHLNDDHKMSFRAIATVLEEYAWDPKAYDTSGWAPDRHFIAVSNG